MVRLWPAYLMRHRPFLAHLVFANEKAWIWINGSNLAYTMLCCKSLSWQGPWMQPCAHNVLHQQSQLTRSRDVLPARKLSHKKMQQNDIRIKPYATKTEFPTVVLRYQSGE